MLFMPAFTLKNLLEDEFFGEDFWKAAKKARKRDKRAQNIRDFMKLNKECQKVAPSKYSGDGGNIAADLARMKKKQANPSWMAREKLDAGKIRADELAPKKKVEKTRGDRLEDRYAKEDKTGFRRFDLNAEEAKRSNAEEPKVRQDRKFFTEADVIKGSKSKQNRDKDLAARGGYQGPKMVEKKKKKQLPPKPSRGNRRDLGLR